MMNTTNHKEYELCRMCINGTMMDVGVRKEFDWVKFGLFAAIPLYIVLIFAFTVPSLVGVTALAGIGFVGLMLLAGGFTKTILLIEDEEWEET